MTGTEPASAPPLSTRTVQTYAQDWALFTDWCAATGHPALPAAPDAVLRFLADCPATRSTQRCRVAAIDHHHAGVGLPKPGESGVVRAALGRPVGDRPAPPVMPDQVAAALRGLPSHGWTQGMFGRRDRCLLVLSQMGGVPYQDLAALTVGDVANANGATTVTTRADTWTVMADADPVLCGPCAITRWVRVVDLAVARITSGTVAAAVDKADPVTAQSPHLCRSTRPLNEATLVVPVFSSINQWGALPFPLHRLTPHSLSRRVREQLDGRLGAHRHLPVDTTQTNEPETPEPGPMREGPVYGREDAQRAWLKRHADLEKLTGVDDQLDDVDKRIAELNRRAAMLLDPSSANERTRDIDAYTASVTSADAAI